MAPNPPSDLPNPATPNGVGRPEELLKLARSGDAEARARLAALSAETLANSCIELDARSRGEFLVRIENPEQVVPLLPETEFALALNAIGKDDAQMCGGVRSGTHMLLRSRPSRLRTD